jgi:hypothetical protein
MQNEIVNKIAEWLQISVEKAIELYPQLRTEAVWYTVGENLWKLIFYTISLLVIITFINWLTWLDDKRDETKEKRYKRWLIALIVSTFLFYILNIVFPFLYPNIVFFKQFVK